MIGTVAITDQGWYEFLRTRPEVTELNFWTPSPRRAVHAEPFSPFLFKLRAPRNAICGFAFFAQWSALPDWLAWECFGLGNGCPSLESMQERIGRLRRGIGFEAPRNLAEIGCILLVNPVFFAPTDLIAQPSDWPVRTQTSKRYDLAQGEGARVWQECLAGAVMKSDFRVSDGGASADSGPRFGKAQVIHPRLGQGTFRVAVTDAYGRACAVTGEHSLPALDAAHIRPFAADGPHDVRNGLLLRSDLHRLFDKGYVTVTPEFRFEVSARLRDDFKNGRSYYPLHGSAVRTPDSTVHRPAAEFLRWHNESVFLS